MANSVYNLLNRTLGNSIVKGVLLLALVFTNSIVNYIWLSPKNRNSVSILLSIIALFDTLTIICGSMNTMTSYIAGFFLSVKGCYIVVVTAVLAFVFHSLSILTTTYLAVQRCVVCAFPFSGPRICGIKTTLIFTIVSFVSVFGLRVPDLLFHDIDSEIIITDDNISLLNCEVNYVLDDYTMTKLLPKMYMFIRFFALHLIPAIVITFCMIICLLTVNRKKMVKNKSKEQVGRTRTTIMLVLIMLIFVLGEFPTTISVFYRAFFPKEPIWLKTAAGNWFCNITLEITYLLNIWVYIGISKQFRDSLKNIFCGSPEIQSVNQVKTDTKLTSISTVTTNN